MASPPLTGCAPSCYAPVEPGPHTLRSLGEEQAPVVVQVEAGRSYFFQQEVAFGAQAARSSLIPMDEVSGRSAVQASEMAASNPPVVSGSGCSRDTECKGDRVCRAGRCEDPARP